MPPSQAAKDGLERIKRERYVELSADTKTELLAKAKIRTDESTSGAAIFKTEAEKRVLRFTEEELNLGKELGTGGFSTASEIKSFNINVPDPLSITQDSREYMASNPIRNEGGIRYAVKKLSLRSLSDKECFEKGTADLAIEARMLAVLRHDSIIKIRGFANTGYFDGNFFILMDRLQYTLDKQIIMWRKKLESYTSILACCRKADNMERVEEIKDERIQALLSIAEALNYLHLNKIVYRDIKPENIGFDVRERAKLFDFGLAKELPSQSNSDGTYNLTGFTGSLHYMAPEIFQNRPYNQTADTYSFAILMWSVFTLKKPFATYTQRIMRTYVVERGQRLSLDDDGITDGIKMLLTECWNDNLHQRLLFDQIILKLKTLYEGENEQGAGLDASTKSFTAIMERVNKKS